MFYFKVVLNSASSGPDVQLALNDLPTLYSNLVISVNADVNGNDKIFTVTFSSDLGSI